MTMKTNIKLFTLALTATAAFSSCSDQFLQDKKNYEQVSEDVYNYVSGANGRVNDVYYFCQPMLGSQDWKNTSSGSSDVLSLCTEEYTGFDKFNDPQIELTYLSGSNSVPDWFQNQNSNIQTAVWGRIRECNDVIRGITNGNIPQENKDQFLGQVYFWRAWCYYNLVRWYGGVPIIKEVQDPVAESQTPRSSTKATIDFICEDLQTAADLLAPYTTNGQWMKGENYGRVTTGTALAMKGRVLLLWASPLFNRANDEQRWKDAYDFMEQALPTIKACGYNYAETNPETNAANWARIFTPANNSASSEAVFVTLHNTIESGGTPDYQRNNGWESGIRPSNAWGGGGKTPSEMIVSMFPMADGKRPSNIKAYSKLSQSKYSYDQNAPFMNRDPRFYRTFAFPGVRWAFDGDPRMTTGDDRNMNPYDGSDYVLWNYVWYTSAEDRNNVESGNTFGPDNLMGNVKGFYIRKRSDDLDVNPSPLYVFNNTDKFGRSASPWMEMRFTEVMLNLAEAACGAGNMSRAVEILKDIRKRVYKLEDYEEEIDENYGLDANLNNDQAACMSAVLYERQIELAYEGKRFDDMRRWMLFDGGTGTVNGAPASWKLTGWGGNTCTWLGYPQMNGQRRDNFEYMVKEDYNNGLGGREYPVSDNYVQENPDPLCGIAYGTDGKTLESGERAAAAIDLREPMVNQQNTLKAFYDKYLTYKKKKGDSFDNNHAELYFNYRPNYYFLGLTQDAMSKNPSVEQTIGWGDHNHGGANGTFDPLAE